MFTFLSKQGVNPLKNFQSFLCVNELFIYFFIVTRTKAPLQVKLATRSRKRKNREGN